MILFCFLLPSVERSTAPKYQRSRKIGGKDWAVPPIIEDPDSFLHDFSHLLNRNLDLNASVRFVGGLGSLSFNVFSPPLEIQTFDCGLELFVGSQVTDLQHRSQATIDKSSNKAALVSLLLDVSANL